MIGSLVKLFYENPKLYNFLLKFFSVRREYTTTLRINKIELLKPVDDTMDRMGFEKPLNPYAPEGK